jgi:hypothetical protein
VDALLSLLGVCLCVGGGGTMFVVLGLLVTHVRSGAHDQPVALSVGSVCIPRTVQGVRYGSAGGRNLLPRVLHLLSFDNESGVVGRQLDSAVGVPLWVWLPWTPQLLLCLHRPEMPHAKKILKEIALAYPQVRACKNTDSDACACLVASGMGASADLSMLVEEWAAMDGQTPRQVPRSFWLRPRRRKERCAAAWCMTPFSAAQALYCSLRTYMLSMRDTYVRVVNARDREKAAAEKATAEKERLAIAAAPDPAVKVEPSAVKAEPAIKVRERMEKILEEL